MITETTIGRDSRSFRGGDYVVSLMAELDRAEISKRIRAARKVAGFRNRRDLADVMQVHWRTIEDWENPKHQNVPYDRMEELALVLHTTKWWLLHGEEAERVMGVGDLQARLEALEVQVSESIGLTREALELLHASFPQGVVTHLPRKKDGTA
jgi:transcriptional regulator with XRE-family HTH domain